MTQAFLQVPNSASYDDRAAWWNDATFLPTDEESRTDALRDRVWKTRQAAFIAFTLSLSGVRTQSADASGFLHCISNYKSMSEQLRRQLIESPAFISWFSLITSTGAAGRPLKDRLAQLNRIMSRMNARKRNTWISFNEYHVELARFDVDPVIKEAALPDYEFPDNYRTREFENTVPYPPRFFQEVIDIVLERIRRAWPAAHREFFKYVRLIVDMVDADVTSYSGSNHVGAIFVSTDNSPLVALEEYLIHELGHQILYNVMVLDPLVINEPSPVFRLPWSGRERDLYGYLHAFYIYAFLAHYLRRVHKRSKREQNRISRRLSHILGGLDQAANELLQVDMFTPRGKRLFKNVLESGWDAAPF